MIEITKQFAAEVKKIRKVTGVRGKDADILPTKTHITEFSKHAKDILSTIRQVLTDSKLILETDSVFFIK